MIPDFRSRGWKYCFGSSNSDHHDAFTSRYIEGCEAQKLSVIYLYKVCLSVCSFITREPFIRFASNSIMELVRTTGMLLSWF